MGHPHGLVIQNTQVNSSLVTLASKAALEAGSGFTAITATFLVKRVKYMLMIEGVTASEGPIAFCMARGDAAASEAASGVTEGNTSGPSDVSQLRSQDNAFNIVQVTLAMFETQRTQGEDMWLNKTIKMPGKGIPFREGQGWTFFTLNLDQDALTTGMVVKGVVQVWGVWLRD